MDAATPLPVLRQERSRDSGTEPQQRHDAEHGNPRQWQPLPPGWNSERLMPSWPLTDQRIAVRRRQGYFSEPYREAIRSLVAAKAAANKKRGDG